MLCMLQNQFAILLLVELMAFLSTGVRGEVKEVMLKWKAGCLLRASTLRPIGVFLRNLSSMHIKIAQSTLKCPWAKFLTSEPELPRRLAFRLFSLVAGLLSSAMSSYVSHLLLCDVFRRLKVKIRQYSSCGRLRTGDKPQRQILVSGRLNGFSSFHLCDSVVKIHFFYSKLEYF